MAVIGMVSAVSGFVKIRYLLDRAIIDNMVFRCHYRMTTAILFVCCIIVTANNLIGDPINCINDGSIPMHVINTFCWITYTYTIPGQQHRQIGTDVASHGLGNEYGEEKRYHSYYQWVPFVLFFQGLMFYVPHWIWKNLEDGKMRMITEGLRGMITIPEDYRKERQNRIVQYFIDSLNSHNGYSFGYFFCECLNFVNVILNIFMVDKFLGGAFMTYGTEVIKFSNMNQENRYDPMIEIFPRLTKCTFHKYGPGGSPQKHDTLCVLALNILNEKIYIFLWFWFIILSVISAAALLYSFVLISMPTTRETVLKRRYRDGTGKEIEGLVRSIDIGDFLILHFLGQNLNTKSYTDMLQDLCSKIDCNRTPSAPSTLEMHPIYPQVDKFSKETET
ncbi:innexin inx3 [Eupeodes corollae]|uniref:innexin inx3 n=1 Tax=Eupeodes corollae TaxID=290404 RepID=UPI002492231F|nr:innexin inx3 [Eupeodes corollae]XP_055908715.1 innexin inx3 [Eupeodes corollae]XP_055908716.1 innexin inx3 [Eupeodes corollae]